MFPHAEPYLIPIVISIVAGNPENALKNTHIILEMPICPIIYRIHIR